jgi:hypothetical protein
MYITIKDVESWFPRNTFHETSSPSIEDLEGQIENTRSQVEMILISQNVTLGNLPKTSEAIIRKFQMIEVKKYIYEIQGDIDMLNYLHTQTIKIEDLIKEISSSMNSETSSPAIRVPKGEKVRQFKSFDMI